MIRIALVACLALLTACKSKTSKEGAASGTRTADTTKATPATPVPTPAPTGDVPKLRWTDTNGELLLASGDGTKLEGPCGLTGTITATEIELGAGTKQPWNIVQRKGGTFTLPRLDWEITVGPGGEVVHARGGTKTPLGTVTGADTDERLAWFGALVIAAPLIQHKVGIETLDGATKLYVQGAADLRAWDARGATGERIAAKLRDDPRPVFSAKGAFDPNKVTVTAAEPGKHVLEIKRDDDATRAAFTADKLTISENDKGELAWHAAADKPGIPFARVTSRATCRAHDLAVTALLWTFLGTDAGAKALAAVPTKRK
ncbi:MAG: hypothetical protein JWP01_1879 [Myxococcales bacterium]|nr:hypothetical protein [Myxococcales bacterium]